MPSREDVLHEPHALECHADCLLTAIPMRVVHDGTIHMGHRRDNGQFHQPFLLELALKPFCQSFAKSQGVDQRLIGNTLAYVSGTLYVECVEE